jgi:hypothetical protein
MLKTISLSLLHYCFHYHEVNLVDNEAFRFK